MKHKEVKIFFFPYAGSSVYNYIEWKKIFPENIEVCLIELAGRGSRMEDPFYKDMDEAVEDIYSILRPQIQDTDYCLFGHSMGNLFAYEMYHKAQENEDRLPLHMYLSGRNPPRLNDPVKRVSHLPGNQFLDSISGYGGVSKQMYEDEGIKEIFLPILKADFRLLEDYQYKERSELIKSDVTVFYGDKDHSTPWDKIRIWSEYVDKDITICQFEGQHFFCFQPKNREYIIKRMIQNNERMEFGNVEE